MQLVEQLVDQIKQNPSAYKIPALLCLIGLILVLGGIFSSNLFSKPNQQFPKESLVKNDQIAQIKVDISGAVKNPGVYQIPKEARIEDAIKVSGGFDEQVSKEYVSKKLNLSQKLLDGQKIYIPFQGEEGYIAQSATSQSAIAGASTSVVGLNSATQAELEALPGIGPVTAQKIIAARPFSETSELLSKKAVSKSIFEKIQPLVDLH